MHTLRRLVGTTVAGLALGATVLGAQAPRPAQRHEGFFIGFGIGASNNDLDCTGCNFTSETDPWRGGFGSGGYLAMGGALSQQLLLGGELSGSSVMSGERDATIGSLLFIAQYYPGAFEGFHVKGGLGPTGVMLQGDGSKVEATGFAVQAGVGYDFRVGRRFAITPYANIARTAVQQGSLTMSGSSGTVTRLENRVLAQFGIGFNWY